MEWLPLPPFTIEESHLLLCKTLKCEQVDELFLAFLHTRSGGNPFFAKELAEGLKASKALQTDESTHTLNVANTDDALSALAQVRR